MSIQGTGRAGDIPSSASPLDVSLARIPPLTVVIRLRTVYPTSRKVAAEASVEHHYECCDDGTCVLPQWISVRQGEITLPAGATQTQTEELVWSLLQRLLSRSTTPHSVVRASRGRGRDDSVLSGREDIVRLGPPLF